MGLCMATRKGEEVVPLRPRCIINAHSPEPCPASLFSFLLSVFFPVLS